MSLTDRSGNNIGTSGSGTARRLLVDAGTITAAPSPTSLTTGNITAAGNTVVDDVTQAGTLFAFASGNFVGANLTFEGSLDGTNWFGISGVRTNANTIEGTSGIISATLGYGWKFNVAGLVSFRARATAITSGTLVFTSSASPDASETAPGIGTHAVTGSGSFTVAGSVTTTPIAPTSAAYALAATTNLTANSAVACSLYELTLFNGTAATIFLKLYNKTTAPVLATDVPIVIIPVAAGAAYNHQFGAVGKRFPTGLAFAVTGAVADTDTTAIALGAKLSITRV